MLFSSRAAAEDNHEAIRRLAQSLRRGVQNLREEKAQRALAEVPPSPASLAEARADLRQIAQAVQRVLDADGAKIYVLRRAPKGPMVWRLCNTQAPEEKVIPVPLLVDHGMADWVLREGKWLLLPEFKTPVAGVKQQGVTEDGTVEVIARPASEMEKGAPPDAETSVLLVPLTGKASVAGVLSVWREDRAALPLDQTLDRESLEQFAPHIAAACQRLLQLEKAEEQLAEMSALVQTLAKAGTLRDGYDAVAAGTARLADAACALLLHHDYDDEHGHRLYPTGIWTTVSGPIGQEPLGATPALRCSSDMNKWQTEVEPALRGVFSPLTFRGLLLPPTEKPGDVPTLTVGLFDDRSTIETEFPSDRMLGHFARAFLQAAAVLLDRHVADLASYLADDLGRPSGSAGLAGSSAPDSSRDPKAILEQATGLLRRATGADAALVYMGTPNHMTVRASLPVCKQLIELAVGPQSLTRMSLHERKARLVLEAGSDSEHLNKNQLDVIAKALHWSEVRSWLCCPVVHHDRVVGMVKLLTNTKGAFLGTEARDLTEKLAERVSWEMYQANRRQVLESLAVLSRHIASFTGRKLGEEMASRLRDWAENVLLRPECRVVVLAQVSDGAPVVRAAAWPKREATLSENEFAQLEALSSQREESFYWGPHQPRGVPVEALRSLSQAGAAHTVKIPGVSQLKGHILFADREIFSVDERDSVREAARAMAVLLNAETERNKFKQTVARFRHATLGPIQGVQSNALYLADLAEEAGADPEEVRRYRESLEADIEVLRLWRQNERFYLSGDKVDIRPRSVPLRPLVEHCFERYYPALAERNIEHRLVWLPRGDLQVELDEHAFDLALSNLLDNAQKYSFANREVVVEVRVLRDPLQPLVQITIEDSGHGIDESNESFIFEVGKREGRFDPFRIIPGEGLGLPMANAIIEAHQGDLYCRSEVSGAGRKADTTPYRVRFFVKIPFYQPRRSQ